MKFLSPEAPQEFMKNGAFFELLEGPRVVAVGKIICDNL